MRCNKFHRTGDFSLSWWFSVGALVVVLFAVVSPRNGMAVSANRYKEARMEMEMVAAIEADVRLTSRRIGKRRLDPRVMEALATVPRDEFVPSDRRRVAYENRPLAIGFGQTISQPYIVALMTDLLDVKSDAVMLEIGTGSGYQAAILSAVVILLTLVLYLFAAMVFRNDVAFTATRQKRREGM